jgi:hypothetical protein
MMNRMSNFLRRAREWVLADYTDEPVVRTEKEHDFRNARWGWAVHTSSMRELGQGKFSVLGHGYGIKKGDWIRLCTGQKPKEGRKFLVLEIEYKLDPRDMFKVVLIQDEIS